MGIGSGCVGVLLPVGWAAARLPGAGLMWLSV